MRVPRTSLLVRATNTHVTTVRQVKYKETVERKCAVVGELWRSEYYSTQWFPLLLIVP